MLEYIIKYTMDNMPEGYIGSALKWARNADEAVKLILAKSGWKNDVTVVFKRGGTGKIISVEEVEKNERIHY
tara:strand:+ start:63 stop:278 length:216 start_codon:yes stop_codon:yes gene_type:complete